VSILLRKIRYESSSTREEFVCFGENRRRDDTTEVILYEYDLGVDSHDGSGGIGIKKLAMLWDCSIGF
jgi:hypothetical protein